MLSFTFASAPTSKNSALVASACLGRSELTQKAQALEAAEEINIEKAENEARQCEFHEHEIGELEARLKHMAIRVNEYEEHEQIVRSELRAHEVHSSTGGLAPAPACASGGFAPAQLAQSTLFTICVQGANWGSTVTTAMTGMHNWKIDLNTVNNSSYHTTADRWFVRFKSHEQARAALALLPKENASWAMKELSETAAATTGDEIQPGTTLWLSNLDNLNEQAIMQVIMHTGDACNCFAYNIHITHPHIPYINAPSALLAFLGFQSKVSSCQVTR